jgi:hypothetical protein
VRKASDSNRPRHVQQKQTHQKQQQEHQWQQQHQLQQDPQQQFTITMCMIVRDTCGALERPCVRQW